MNVRSDIRVVKITFRIFSVIWKRLIKYRKFPLRPHNDQIADKVALGSRSTRTQCCNPHGQSESTVYAL